MIHLEEYSKRALNIHIFIMLGSVLLDSLLFDWSFSRISYSFVLSLRITAFVSRISNPFSSFHSLYILFLVRSRILILYHLILGGIL